MRSGSRAARPNVQRHPQTAVRPAGAEKAIQRRADAILSGSRGTAQSRAQCISDHRCRAQPGAGARGRRADRGGQGAAAHRHSGGAQGHFLRQGLAHHLRLENAGELRQPLRRARGGTAQRGRRRDPGQDQHGRVRHGLVQRNLLLRPGEESLGPDARPGRLLRRLGRGGGRAPGAGGDRHRHRRLHPPARGALRHLPASSPPTAWFRATA